MKNICIIDYGLGNVRSMTNAFENLGSIPLVTADHNKILNSDALVLPGVGAFKHGMDNLRQRNLVNTIFEFVKTGKPFLGVCLGMQMLMVESEEFGISKGLGLINGVVKKINLPKEGKEKLPHVSWNELQEPAPDRWKGTILDSIDNLVDTYFVHSFVAAPDDPNDILASCKYGDINFCAAVHHKNVYGTQFHPEKSGKQGLQMLKNFIKLIS